MKPVNHTVRLELLRSPPKPCKNTVALRFSICLCTTTVVGMQGLPIVFFLSAHVALQVCRYLFYFLHLLQFLHTILQLSELLQIEVPELKRV